MDPDRLMCMLVVFGLAIGWFAFVGKAVGADAKSRSIRDADEIARQCTLQPWQAVIYLFTRNTLPTAPHGVADERKHKIASVVYFFLALCFMACAAAALLLMRKSGVISFSS